MFNKEGQISILFPKDYLYKQFVDTLSNELRAIASNKERKIFVTHIRDHRCVITCTLGDNVITISGEGHVLWRQTAFIRYGLGLYKFFTTGIDDELSQSQTSTPVIKRLCHDSIPAGISPVLHVPDKLNNDSALSLLNELKCQVDSLQKVTKDIDVNVLKCHDKINCLQSNINQSNRSEPTVPGQSTYSQIVGNRNDDDHSTTHSKKTGGKQSIPKEKTRAPQTKNTPVTSQSPLAGNSRNIEVVINRHSKNPGQPQNSTPKTLLIGDSILNKINMKGIKNNVHKHSVSGATLPTIINDIELFDLKIFDTIVVYIGGNDSARNVDLGLIEEKYEQLISILKSANPNIRLVLCKIAPRGDTDETFVNAIIERLSVRHSCEIVDQYRAFFDRHGELILRYYGQHDQIHLSISGTRRLLGYINEKVEIVYDFNKCTFPRRRNNDQRNHSGRSYRNAICCEHDMLELCRPVSRNVPM